MNDEQDLIWESSALFGPPLPLGARCKLPLLPPPIGGTGSDTRWGSAIIRILYTWPMLHLPVMPVMIIAIMRLSCNKRAVPDGTFRHQLFHAVLMRMTYPSRFVYFRWSRVHTAVKTDVTAPVRMWERCKSRVQLQGSEIGAIQAPMPHGSYQHQTCTRLKICFCAFWTSSHDGH